MKKLFKQITYKRIIYVTLGISWFYFLMLFAEVRNHLTEVKNDLWSVKSMDNQIREINGKLNSIDQKLEYDYTSVDQNDYESIKHYRINKKSGDISELDSYGRRIINRSRW